MNAIIKSGLMAMFVMWSMSTLLGQKKVKTFTVDRIIQAPAENVWKVVGEDFGAIANSHPLIVSSTYLNGSLKGGEGAERQCNMNAKGTKYVREKQINYDPDNYTFKAKVYHVGKLPLDPDHNFAVYRVEPIDENTSRLIFNMTLRTKPAFMGGMAKNKFKKTIADYLLAVDHHVRTGETVNRNNFKEIKKNYQS
ncbi:MAG: SRPBCC family protein [Bacteroidota bacterium]